MEERGRWCGRSVRLRLPFAAGGEQEEEEEEEGGGEGGRRGPMPLDHRHHSIRRRRRRRGRRSGREGVGSFLESETSATYGSVVSFCVLMVYS